MKTLCTLSLAIGMSLLQAQTFDWAKQTGGATPDAAYSVATDASGNVFTIGGFTGTVDFDDGPDEIIYSSAGGRDIFISKHDASGNLVWVKHIGGEKNDVGSGIAIDGIGNILITGSFYGTVDFDPGEGSNVFSIPLLYYSSGGTPYLYGSDIFICKLDADGNFIWARQVGGNLDDIGKAIATDASGNVFTTGEYSAENPSDSVPLDSVDFDPGPETFNLGGGGGFISKLDEGGDFVWARQFGRNSGGSVACGGVCVLTWFHTISFESITLDASGNVYSTGSFISTDNDFDPGETVYNMDALGTRDAFVCKLTNEGNFVWARQFGRSGATASARDLAVDAGGNVYSTGYFIGKVDFDPGAGVVTLTSTNPPGQADIFVSKLTATGNYGWAKSVGTSEYDLGTSIAVDAQANVYYTGYFDGKADFDPGSKKYLLTSTGYDCFISSLTTTGAFRWARKLGGSGDDWATAISVDDDLNIYTTGGFSVSVDFDPNESIYELTSAGSSDAFVLKLSQGSLLAPPVIIRSTPDLDVTVYPNPTRERVTIAFHADTESDYQILLIDVTGRILQTHEGKSLAGRNEHVLHFGNIPAGIYQVILHMGVQREMNMLLVE